MVSCQAHTQRNAVYSSLIPVLRTKSINSSVNSPQTIHAKTQSITVPGTCRRKTTKDSINSMGMPRGAAMKEVTFHTKYNTPRGLGHRSDCL